MPRKHGEYPSVREAILSSAASLFIRRGIHASSLGDIAAEARLSKGTLYYYYPAKEELVLTIAGGCLERVSDTILSWLDTLGREEPLRQAMTRLFAALTEEERHCRLLGVILSECVTEDSTLRTLVQEHRQKWRVMLELGALRMQGRGQPLLGRGTELFFALLTGQLIQGLSGMGGHTPEELADILLK